MNSSGPTRVPADVPYSDSNRSLTILPILSCAVLHVRKLAMCA